MAEKCIKCGCAVTYDEKGLCRKMIGRTITEFMCMDCLAEKFKVEKQSLINVIEFYKKAGCALFN